MSSNFLYCIPGYLHSLTVQIAYSLYIVQYRTSIVSNLHCLRIISFHHKSNALDNTLINSFHHNAFLLQIYLGASNNTVHVSLLYLTLQDTEYK